MLRKKVKREQHLLISKLLQNLRCETERDNYIFRSIRHGLAYFAIGGLKAAAALLFNEDNINVIIQDDLSTNECKHY